MQYILSEDEYNELSDRLTPRENQRKNESLLLARRIILKMAGESCVYENFDTRKYNGEYCDDCPVIEQSGGPVEYIMKPNLICNLPKRWSK